MSLFKKKRNPEDLPSTPQLEKEIKAERYRKRYNSTLRSTVYILVTVAATAVLIATLVFPIFQIFGTSMSPTLEEGNVVIGLRTTKFETGDLVAFYYNNKILIKRVVAHAGEWIDIDEEGNVYVNGEIIYEPYISEKSLGNCDIKLPYQVPDRRIFVMGDNRADSIDSRSSTIGCIEEEQIAGKLFLCVWPLNQFGLIR